MRNMSDYKRLSVLHKSNNFITHKATRISDNRKVVLKEPVDYQREQSIVLLSSEFEIGKLFIHKNIVKYIDFVRTDIEVELVREYFDGVLLEDCIPENGFDMDAFLKIAIQIVDGLNEIHNKNIIHQAINPYNILVNKKDFSIKISNFSSATYNSYQVRGDLNNYREFIAYISPEQTGRMNRNIDYRSDLYSLGITFYKMITGKLPCESDDILELVHWQIAKTADSPNIVKESVPVVVSNIINKLIDKNVDNRYQSAQGLKYDIDYCLNNISQLDNDFEIASMDYSSKFKIPQKLYGRQKEIKVLNEQFHNVCDGDTVILMVTGYSGIGKSAIVNELQKEITMKDAYFAFGKYEHLKRNITYSAITDAFKDLIKQILGESDQRIALWRRNFRETLGYNGQVIVDIIPELELIIGKQQPVIPLGSTETQNRFNMVFQRFVSVFHRMAHPLVIFLDDLQWIDLASLNLIKLITAEHLTKSFFFIGAYRSNEVDDSHPAITTMKEIKKTGVNIKYINLKPLDFHSIKDWIGDTLNSQSKGVNDLSALILDKTNGNPFFVKSFLFNLYNEQLIQYKGKSQWEWNLKDIVALQPTDNVTELMAQNIEKLPVSSRELITFASCIGISFGSKELSVISEKSEKEVTRLLQPVLASGMIYQNDSSYKFIHDKVLEAAYSLIPDNQKPQRHLKIGRLLLCSYSDQDIEENLFDIVEHLNKGISLIESKEDIHELLELNVRVAQKAKSSAAYKNAGYFFEIADGLMPENSWEIDYQLSLKMYSAWAEAEYMSTNFNRAEELFSVVLEKADNILDKTRIYQMILVYNENRRRFRDAVELSVKVINELGVTFPDPESINDDLNKKQVKRFYKNIKNKDIKLLIELPQITDPIQQEAIGVLVSVMVPYWNTYPEALLYLCYEIVNLSIEKGLCSIASLGFSMLGSILAMEESTVDLGFQLADLAIAITDRFEDKFHETSVKYLFYNHVHFWRKPLRWRLEYLIEAYHTGIETGNNQWASYCLNHYCMRFLIAGDRLDVAKEHYDTYTESMYRLKQDAPLTYFNPPRQTVFNLLGMAEDRNILTGEAFNEEVGISEFYETKQFSAIGLAYICKLLVLTIFSEYEKALYIVETKDSESFIRANTSQFQPYIGLCLYGLVLMQNYENASFQKQKEYLDKAIALSEEFKKYSRINHLNYAPMYYLLSAEICKITKQDYEAIDLYDKAIKAASENQYLHLEGLANELYADFWFQRHKVRVANSYILDAYNCYMQWGCVPKLKLLKDKYPGLLSERIIADDRMIYEQSDSLRGLDMHSIQKAIQAISSEIFVDRLLPKLMQVIIENTGAQKGYIVLENEGEFFIVAGFNIEGKEKDLFNDIKLEGTDLLSESIVRYVIRTGESVILSNAYERGPFVKDPYIVLHSCKSILAMPILYKNEVQGTLFVENNLSTDVFSEERTKILNLVLSQAAISLENAKLFNEISQSRIALSAEKEFTEKVINTLSDTFFLFDPHIGKAVLWNRAFREISGYSDQEIAELEAPTSYYGPDDLKKASPFFVNVMKTGCGSIELELICKDGRKVLTEYQVSVISDEEGNPKYFISIGRDVTERKKAQELMIQTEKMMSVGGLAAGMAHEINNPLAAIIQGIQNTQRRVNPDFAKNKQIADKHGIDLDSFGAYMKEREIDVFLNGIKHAGMRAAEIVTNMLNFSRQSEALHKEENINSVMDEAIDLASHDYDLSKMYDFKKIEIVRKYQTDISNINCVKSEIEQVILNILKNGAQEMNEKALALGESSDYNPEFLIKTYEKKKRIIIEIEDNGPGMDEETRKRVFEPFFTTKPVGKGTGLGLSVSYFIITQNHGGKMSVDSEAGKGTRFVVELPVK